MVTHKHWLVLTVLMLMFLEAPVLAAPLDVMSGAEVITAVNALRASHGLEPYAMDAILMAAAQGQADYLASKADRVGDGHIGPGGTDADARALALGYPYVTGLDINENWGTLPLDAPIETLIFNGWSDEEHRHTMLHPRGQRAGAGVAVRGGSVIVVLDVAAYWGDAGLTTQPGLGVALDTDGMPAAVLSQYIAPVVKAEAAEDGSITHVVQSGQSLWMLSHHYDVPIERLQQLNRLSVSDVIYIGQPIMIRPPGQVNPTATPDTPPPTPMPEATATQNPPRTQTQPA